MSTRLAWRVLVATAAALQGPADGLALDPAAAVGAGAVEAQQRQEGRRALRSRPDGVSPENAIQARGQSAQGEAAPVLDGVLRRWLQETLEASEDLGREVGEQESGLMDAAPTSAEGKDQEMQQSILDRVDPTNASALSELGEPELSRVSAFRATRPERKERRRRRHFRRAPRASRRKRAKIEREMAEWLPGAVETERAAEETFESVDNELLGQLLNFTSETNETPSLDRAERELKTIQEIWDRYELDNENVTAMDIVEKLYPSNDTWYGDAVHRLHAMNETESHEVAVRLREEVERLKAELERVRDQMVAEKELLEAQDVEQDQTSATAVNESSGAGILQDLASWHPPAGILPEEPLAVDT